MGAPSRLPFLLLALLAAAFAGAGLPRAAAAGGFGRGPLVGGYQPIKNVNDPHVEDIGRYAVVEHNRQSGDSLAFLRVVSGKQQVVAGMNYDLVLEARGGGGARQYEAVVYERTWENFRNLTSFKPKA